MKKKIKVSVILPIYNVEKYLRRCVDSILNQTLEDIEIILATDGGEECDRICREYARKDKRVTLVMHPGSYGKAFNQSLKIAKGKYVGIVEADDWCDPAMFKKLYERAEATSADVVKGGFYFAFDDERNNFKVLYDGYEENFSLLKRPDFLASQPSVWSCIYNKDFLLKNKIFMMNERLPFIDVPFHYETLFMARKYQIVKEPLYFYYQDNPNQSVRNVKPLAGITTEEKGYAILFQKTDLYEALKEGLIYATTCHLRWNYERLASKDIKVFWSAAHKFLNTLSLGKIQYVYFTPQDKEFFLMLLHDSYFKCRLKNIFCKMRGGLKKVFSVSTNLSNNHIGVIVLGIKLKIKKHSVGNKMKKLFQRLFSVKNSSNKMHKIINILGIKLKFKNYKKIRKNKKDEERKIKSAVMDISNKINLLMQNSVQKDEQIKVLQADVLNISDSNESRLEKVIYKIRQCSLNISGCDSSESNVELYDEEFYKINAKESYASACCVIDILKKYYQPKSVIDLGCGVGTWLKAWQENGAVEVMGVDANQMPEKALYIPRDQLKVIDFEASSFSLNRKYDLAQSLECLEHVSQQNEDKILSILYDASDLILFSAAIPLQVGTHHINCHNLQYWVDKFKEHGYKCYDIIRPECIKNSVKIGSWYIQNILVFAKGEKAQILERNGAKAVESPILFYHAEILKDILGSLYLLL